jgi:hypothetical protein
MTKVLAPLIFVLGLPGRLLAGEPGREQVDYLRDVKPIFTNRCVACHGALKQKAGLRLDTAASLKKGGESGPAVVAGKSEESLLLEAVTGSDGWRMPPEGEPLSAREIGLLRAWVDQGADTPTGESEPVDPRSHWAFLPPIRPVVPTVKNLSWVRNPIDAFLASEHEARGLRPRPPADKQTLLRRVALDLTGLAPTPEELRAFLADNAPDAYERAVDRLLASPRYGERWGRHWMDVWRYSDWDGFGAEVRESQPHIWHWRDWIVESLNQDKGYDRMVVEMLAADEAAPEDAAGLRATGYLVRSWFKFNRNVWLDNAIEHTSKAFLGLTINCARCHDHKYDPIGQTDYYRFRAFFEPYDVRTDRIPGQPDTAKDGLPRVYDANLDVATHLFRRGDDKEPEKEKPLAPGLPAFLCRAGLAIEPVALPKAAYYPSLQRFVQEETLAQARAEVQANEGALAKARQTADAPRKEAGKNPATVSKAKAEVALAEQALAASRAGLTAAEAKVAADAARFASPPRPDADLLARLAAMAERQASYLKADQALAAAEAAVKEAEAKGKQAVAPATARRDAARKALESARAALAQDGASYTPLFGRLYPTRSTGRRLSLARWIARPDNPLTARVAINHIWLRHFGAPIVPTVFDFGLNGRPPTHRGLLDWLAVTFMEQGWGMKAVHRLIVTSNAYRMQSSASGPDDPNLALDLGNIFLWRLNPRRMEAELVRDNLLHLAGNLDPTMGGPDLAPEAGQTSRRRSVYFRHAKEKRMTFLQLFDSANVISCYRRSESVVPQQALALANSPLSFEQARRLAARFTDEVGASRGADAAFVAAAFERIVGRGPSREEQAECESYLVAAARQLADRTRLTAFTSGPAASVKPAADPAQRARENLVHVLFNHNDFVTIR